MSGRVLRGGSWFFDSRYLRSASRGKFNFRLRNYDFGFRVARTLLHSESVGHSIQTGRKVEPEGEEILDKPSREPGATTDGVTAARHRLFLAHAREDKRQVRTLYADLKARGLDPWLDEIDLIPGHIWKTEIPKGIRQARIFLACLSSRSVEKVGYVQNEFRIALSAFRDRPPGSIYLIPVRLDDCEVPDFEIPDRGLGLRDIHWVDLWQEGGFDRLVAAIEHSLGVITPPKAAGDEAPTAITTIDHETDHRPEPETRKERLEAGDLPKPGTVFRDIDAPWCPELVVIPPGEFMMGSTEAERDRAVDQGAKRQWVEWEKPQHRVSITYPLAVGRYPITFEVYDHFAQTTRRGLPPDEGWGRGRHPIISVSWDDAKAYVEWLAAETGHQYRLLSEAEWEYACRAKTTTRYWWGHAITPTNANYRMIVGKTSEVGSYPANPFGLSDMQGNIWEWAEDCWHDSYAGAPDDGSAWIAGTDSRRVLRGGSWSGRPENLRAACRGRNFTDVRNNRIGFRVARALEPLPLCPWGRGKTKLDS